MTLTIWTALARHHTSSSTPSSDVDPAPLRPGPGPDRTGPATRSDSTSTESTRPCLTRSAFRPSASAATVRARLWNARYAVGCRASANFLRQLRLLLRRPLRRRGHMQHLALADRAAKVRLPLGRGPNLRDPLPLQVGQLLGIGPAAPPTRERPRCSPRWCPGAPEQTPAHAEPSPAGYGSWHSYNGPSYYVWPAHHRNTCTGVNNE